MNALWITRMSAYKQTPEYLKSAEQIIFHKITRQNAILTRYKKDTFPHHVQTFENTQHLMLYEGRAAQHYWRRFHTLLPSYSDFMGRKARSTDTVNRLLDIGYHHLTNKVKRILERLQIPADLGLLHVARNADSTPLAYDIVELFRADIEVLTYLRRKKKELTSLEQEDIAHFLAHINQRLARKHYLQTFKQCHTYSYYMELQVLKFVFAVNHKREYLPIVLPSRHDSRCALDTKVSNGKVVNEHGL